MIVIKQLTTKAQIENACALLYDIYIKQIQWEFNPENPSNLRIVTNKKRKLMVDKFTENAIWFGAFDGDNIIGCGRLCGVDEHGKFEVHGYETSKVIHKYLNNNCIEAGRVAVNPDYRKQKIIHKLYLKLFEYSYKNRLNIFGCVSNSYIRSIFNKINLPLIKENAFKYEANDKSFVNFYLINYEKGEYKAVLENLRALITEKNIQYKSLDMLEQLTPIIPVPIYWHNIEGVVLGLNEHCLEGMGANTKDEVIGKTPYDFYPKKIAEKILKHNELVMLTGDVLVQEEEFRKIDTGKIGYAKAIKSPLYDCDGHVIGIVGVSMDITAEKEAEQLKMQNDKNEAKLISQEIFKRSVNKIMNVLLDAQTEAIQNKHVAVTITPEDRDIQLTTREREVLYLLYRNKRTKDIARIIGAIYNKSISPETIKSIFAKQLYPKFQVNTPAQLVEKAQLLNLIPFIPDSFL